MSHEQEISVAFPVAVRREAVASSQNWGVYKQKDQEEKCVALFAFSDGGVITDSESFGASTLADV